MDLSYNVQDIEKYGTAKPLTIRSRFAGRRRRSLVLLLFLFCCGLLGWLGYSGSSLRLTTIFSDNLDDASTTPSSIPTMDNVKMEVNTLIKSHPLIVFSKTYCPYSKKAKAILDSFTYKTPYHIVEVDLRDDADKVKQALGELTGWYTFPNIFVQGISIGGASEIEVIHQQGQLSTLLGSKGIITI